MSHGGKRAGAGRPKGSGAAPRMTANTNTPTMPNTLVMPSMSNSIMKAGRASGEEKLDGRQLSLLRFNRAANINAAICLISQSL
jgi:hypothetical protein